MKKNGSQRLCISLPITVAHSIRIASANQYTTIKNWVLEAVLEKLEKEKDTGTD